MSDTITLAVLLNGVDVTDHINLDTAQPQITSALNEALDTLTLTLKDGDALTITGWQDIFINDGIVSIFGGHVQMPTRKAGADLTKNDYEINATDFGDYLEKVFVVGEYLNQTDAQIIQTIFAGSADLADYDATTYVTAVQTIPRAVFNRKSVREVLNWLVEQSGGYWYVDYDKKLHYFGEVEFRAPFDVTNDPTDATKELVENAQVSLDATKVVNLVEVLGGKALLGDQTHKFTRVGLSAEIYLNKRLAPWTNAIEIAVRRNDGGATTNLLVNPSFEVNITDGWTQAQAGTGAVWAQDASKYNQGTKSLKITAGTGIAKVFSGNITLAPGESLSTQIMAYTAALGMASIVIYDAANLVALVETTNRKTSSWERLTATYLNETAAAMTLRSELRNNAVDSTLVTYFDGAQAEKQAWPSAYCDGSLGTGYAWTGTAHNSTSTRVNMPVWRTLTVKTGNTEPLASRDDVLYYPSEGKLVQETYWPTLSDAIEVDGQEETPVRVIVRNYASHAHYGKWFKTVISDPSIVDIEVARMRAATVLAQNAYETETVSFDVRVPGLRAGQTQNVYLPHRGIDGDYLIQTVTTTIGIGGYITAHVELGAADPGLVALLLKLKRSNSTIDLNNDELMDQVLDFADTFEVTDNGALVTRSSGPYLFDVAKWDYSKYGSE